MIHWMTDKRFHRKSVIHASNEYVDGETHVNTCESYGSLVRPWLSPSRHFKDIFTHYLRTFQLRTKYTANLGEKSRVSV